MNIYIDSEYRCHTTNPECTFREIQTDFFDDKCQTFIEGYRYIPSCEHWTSLDGAVFQGEMIAPFKPYSDLDAAQREYERQKLADAKNALAILLGGEST